MQNEHGTPYDRGCADKFYGRQHRPHYRLYDGGRLEEVAVVNLTEDEIAAYTNGYNSEMGEKDYGMPEVLSELTESNDKLEAAIDDLTDATNQFLKRRTL